MVSIHKTSCKYCSGSRLQCKGKKWLPSPPNAVRYSLVSPQTKLFAQEFDQKTRGDTSTCHLSSTPKQQSTYVSSNNCLLCVLVGLSHWDVYMRIPILIKSSQALWLSSRRSLLIQLGKRSKSSVLLSSAFLLIQIFPQCLLWVCFQDPSFYPLHPLMTEYIKWILYENGRCTSCLLWICSDSCSRAAVYPALLRWRLPGIPKSPRTKQSPGGGRWCTLPPEWRPARTPHSPQNDSMTRSSSSQNLKVHNMRDTEMSLKIILLKRFI